MSLNDLLKRKNDRDRASVLAIYRRLLEIADTADESDAAQMMECMEFLGKSPTDVAADAAVAPESCCSSKRMRWAPWSRKRCISRA